MEEIIRLNRKINEKIIIVIKIPGVWVNLCSPMVID